MRLSDAELLALGGDRGQCGGPEKRHEVEGEHTAGCLTHAQRQRLEGLEHKEMMRRRGLGFLRATDGGVAAAAGSDSDDDGAASVASSASVARRADVASPRGTPAASSDSESEDETAQPGRGAAGVVGAGVGEGMVDSEDDGASQEDDGGGGGDDDGAAEPAGAGAGAAADAPSDDDGEDGGDGGNGDDGSDDDDSDGGGDLDDLAALLRLAALEDVVDEATVHDMGGDVGGDAGDGDDIEEDETSDVENGAGGNLSDSDDGEGAGAGDDDAGETTTEGVLARAETMSQAERLPPVLGAAGARRSRTLRGRRRWRCAAFSSTTVRRLAPQEVLLRRCPAPRHFS
jgi:hypothetical protein